MILCLDSHGAVVAGHDSVFRCFAGGTAHPVGLVGTHIDNIDLTHSGVPVAWPKKGGDHGPEFGKGFLALGWVLLAWAESTHQHSLQTERGWLAGEFICDCET